jgi:hypothetical protein
MRPLLPLLSTALLALVIGTTGCNGSESNGSDQPNGANAQAGDEQDLTTQTDAALQGKLKGIMKDITFMSESDYPYVVLEGEQVTAARLTTKLVREKLRAAVKAASSSHRDIQPASCRSSRVDVSAAIRDGDSAVVPPNPDDDNFFYAKHDKQLGIALKVMRAQLKSVVGFTFGTNASGDQDEFGPVLYIYVGISKTSGKLIAIMTEAVYT